MLLVLLLFHLYLSCLRKEVWTKYTLADVALWQTHSVDETTVPHLPIPTQRAVMAHLPRGFSRPVGNTTLRSGIWVLERFLACLVWQPDATLPDATLSELCTALVAAGGPALRSCLS